MMVGKRSVPGAKDYGSCGVPAGLLANKIMKTGRCDSCSPPKINAHPDHSFAVEIAEDSIGIISSSRTKVLDVSPGKV
jgi:hypothetical protein